MSHDTHSQPFLTASQVADRFQVCRATVYTWAKAGCPCYRFSARGRIRFDLVEVRAWLTPAES